MSLPKRGSSSQSSPPQRPSVKPSPSRSRGLKTQPDAYYTFTLATRQRIIASVTDGDGGSTRYYLTLKDGCAGAEVQCTTASTFPAPSSGTIARNLDAGTYVLMVETDASDTSDYFIDFSVRPPI